MICRSYIRASTDDQKLTVHAQEAEHRQWCDDQGHTLAGVYTDPGVKGARAIEKCDGLMRLLNDLKPGELVIVSKRDRLSRDLIKSFAFERMVEERGADVHSLDGVGNGSTDEAWAQRVLAAFFAEWEVRKTRQRTRTVLQHKKRTGQRYTSRVYGWTADGNSLIPCEDEQRWLTTMREMRSQRFSLQEIADYLNGQDVPAPNGGETWHKQVIARILERETVG